MRYYSWAAKHKAWYYGRWYKVNQMLYEQEDVAYALSMRHDLMQKTSIPQIKIGKPKLCQ